jgi:tetratricopeptide (TPR) repeat protein
MVVLFITGLYVFWTDRQYLLVHEKFGGGVFLIGALILLAIPLAWTWDVMEYQEELGFSSVLFVILGASLCVLGSLILARTGGFFTVWLIGVGIYLIMSFHEGFFFIVWTGFFGPYDNFVGAIGVYVVVTSFLLFLYHDLKFFYLTRIIKKGNKFRREKNYQSALKCFNKALWIYPMFTTAWNNMGNVYFNQGKSDMAIKCYKKALLINPNYNNARRNLEVVGKKTKTM